MSERTCEINGKIFEGVPSDDAAESLCEGCAGDDNPEVCIQLADCLMDNVIWVALHSSHHIRDGNKGEHDDEADM